MFNDIKEFYPTPITLIEKMLSGVKVNRLKTILEPSAGKGNILDCILKKHHMDNRRYYNKLDVDTVEFNPNLQHILKGKGYRVVHNDFLTYNTYKKYDLLIMNPPFSNGDKHLLKAIEIQERHGGKLICILNAETIKNPYCMSRKILLKKLDEYSASIDYITESFVSAERETGVEIALVKIDIPERDFDSSILNDLKEEERLEQAQESYNSNYLIGGDFVAEIIKQYNFEIKAGLKLINEYNKLKPLMRREFKSESSSSFAETPILALSIGYSKDDKANNIINEYIHQTRYKYWKCLFDSKEFTGLFTSNLKEKFYNMLDELKNYDFSIYNISTIKIQLNNEMSKGVEDTIVALFDEFSDKHSYYNEMSKNTHLFDGWKTNKSWKINKKVIIPLNGYDWYSRDMFRPDYKVKDKIRDIEKVFNYLDSGLSEDIDLEKALSDAENTQQTKKIKTKYFLLTFFKKGTCHIEFRNLDLLAKFNLFGSQKKGWIPPSYMKEDYNNMSNEERDVVDSFEGKDSYSKKMKNKDYYNFSTSNILRLNS